MRRWANRKKSALYKHYVTKSTDRANVIADEKYEEYSTKVFNAMDKAAENGKFKAYCYLEYEANDTALKMLIRELEELGFSTTTMDELGEITLVVKWRKR